MVLRLEDLGERRIVAEILPKYSVGIGDDCALIDVGSSVLAVTTDPVPEPAAKLLGNDPDPYWMGWLLVVINASDLSAAGATPLAFIAALEAPSTLPAEEFERLLLGIKEACRSEGLAYAGGNLREGQRLTAVGTAIGECAGRKPLRRTGGKVNDLIVSVGRGGIFWRDAFLSRLTPIRSKDTSPLFRPRTQLRVMSRLSRFGLVHASIDNSDGLIPTLNQLAAANRVQIHIDLDKLTVPGLSPEMGLDAARLWLGWGDWNVIAVISREAFDSAKEAALEEGGELLQIGIMKAEQPGQPVTILRRGGTSKPAPRLESERFARDSWFSAGIQAYMDMILNVDIPNP